MDKILSQHRKKIGDFEVIEFPDEQTVDAIRGEKHLDAPVDLQWSWNYGSEVAELRLEALRRPSLAQPVAEGPQGALAVAGPRRVAREARLDAGLGESRAQRTVAREEHRDAGSSSPWERPEAGRGGAAALARGRGGAPARRGRALFFATSGACGSISQLITCSN